MSASVKVSAMFIISAIISFAFNSIWAAKNQNHRLVVLILLGADLIVFHLNHYILAIFGKPTDEIIHLGC